MQYALEGTLTPAFVFDGRITLRAAVWFQDGKKNWQPPNAVTLIEYDVSPSRE